MTKIIKYPNPSIKDYEITWLAADIAAAATTLTVQNTTGFAVGDLLVLESVGNELSEQVTIATIPSISSITISPGTKFAHYQLAPIQKTPFNKMRFYRSTDNITYTLISTQDIRWEDKYNQGIYIDATGNDTYWYKVEYFNTTTLLSIMSSPLKTPTKIGFMTVEEFKTATKIDVDDDFIAEGLKFGAQEIKRKLYTIRRYSATAVETNFFPITDTLEFADGDLSGTIDKNDFLSWEEDVNGVRTYVTSDITNVDVDRHMITYGTSHPATNKTLYIEYFLTFWKADQLDAKIMQLNTLYAVNYIFRYIPFRRLQKGIGGWTINGVSVDFQMGMLNDVMKSNQAEITHLINDLQRIYIRTTTLRKPEAKPLSWIKSTLQFTSDNVPGP